MMFRYCLTIVAVLMLAVHPLSALAQDDPATYEFVDATTISIPDGWEVFADASGDETAYLQRQTDFMTVELLVSDVPLTAADTPLTMPILVSGMVTFLQTTLDETNMETITVNDAGVTMYRHQARDGAVTVAYAALLANGNVMTILLQTRGTASNAERSVITVLESVSLMGGTAPIIAESTDPGEVNRYFEDPSGDFVDIVDILGPLGAVIALSDHTFDSGTEIRFPLGWEIRTVDPLNPDLIVFNLRTGQVFADLWTPAHLDEAGFSSMRNLMTSIYIIFDPTTFSYDPEDIWIATYGDHFIYFHRYVDGGVPGTQMAVALDNGDILVIDTFNVDAESIDETLAFAMLLDAAGYPELLDQARDLSR